MEKTPFFKKTWFLIITFIFLPPLGIILMWLAKKEWKTFIKIPISIMLAFWSLILGIALFLPADESASTESEVTTIEEVTTEHSIKKNENKTESVSETTRTESTTESTTAQLQRTEKETTTKTPATTVKPTATKPTTNKENTTVKPTTAKPATTKAPTTAKPTTTKAPTTVDPESYVTVYITKSGEKYHYENPCGNGTYYPISLADAKASGYGACEKCVLH